MSRKDFELFAGLFLAMKGYMPELDRQRLIMVYSAELAQGNPRFDYAKFAKACDWELVA